MDRTGYLLHFACLLLTASSTEGAATRLPTVGPTALPTATTLPPLKPTTLPPISATSKPTIPPSNRPTVRPNTPPRTSTTLLPTLMPTSKPIVKPTVPPRTTTTRRYVTGSAGPTNIPPKTSTTLLPTLRTTVKPNTIPPKVTTTTRRNITPTYGQKTTTTKKSPNAVASFTNLDPGGLKLEYWVLIGMGVVAFALAGISIYFLFTGTKKPNEPGDVPEYLARSSVYEEATENDYGQGHKDDHKDDKEYGEIPDDKLDKPERLESIAEECIHEEDIP